MKRIIRTLAISALLAAGNAFAADTGTLSRAESLREKPFATAKVLAPVAAGAKVEIVIREGGWYKVTSGGKTGWVRMLSVRRSAAGGGASIAGIAGVASGRTGTGKVVTTTGVRGLDSEELNAATFNETQVAQAEKYRVSRKDAVAYAKLGKLSLRDVQPLPAPAK